MIIADYKLDTGKKEEGVWLDLIDGARIKIAYNQSERVERKVLTHQEKSSFRGREQNFEEKAQMMMEIFAEEVVLDWEGIDEEEGKPLPYSTENALKLLKECPPIKNFVFKESARIENFVQEQKKTT